MKTALLVIDFINDIAHIEGCLARSAERIAQNHVLEKVNHALHWARTKQHLIILVKVGFHEGYPDCPLHSPLFSGAPAKKALLLGTWGTAFHELLAIHPSDYILVKPRVSCFYATALEALLKAQAVTELVLTGTATNMAVEHTARDGHDRDYKVTILEDACEAATVEAHQSALLSLSRIATLVKTTALK